MLFKPSAKRVAKRILKKVPNLAGQITCILAEKYEALSKHLDQLFPHALIELTAEVSIEEIANDRGSEFGENVALEYMKLSPSFKMLLSVYAQAEIDRISPEQGLAVTLLSSAGIPQPSQLLSQLMKFLIEFRQAVKGTFELAKDPDLDKKLAAALKRRG